MLAGTITLKWSTGNLNGISDDLDPPSHNDLDILEVEEREKMVRHMWGVYTHSRRILLPCFWQDAFEAACEDLAREEVEIRDVAVSEIAWMSMRMVDLEPLPRQRKKEVMINHTDEDGTAKLKSPLSSVETR